MNELTSIWDVATLLRTDDLLQNFSTAWDMYNGEICAEIVFGDDLEAARALMAIDAKYPHLVLYYDDCTIWVACQPPMTDLDPVKTERTLRAIGAAFEQRDVIKNANWLSDLLSLIEQVKASESELDTQHD